MWLLVVDTAGPRGGVLLARNDEDNHGEHPGVEVLGEVEFHPRQFSAELIPAIAELVRANACRLADVDAFAVVAGPGSFTGLRVGISAVKAMAEVTGKPILTLSRLAILASKFSSSEGGDENVHAVLDAGRGEYYLGIYREAGKIRVAESFATLDSLTKTICQDDGRVIVTETSVASALDSIAGSRLRQVPAPGVREALPLAVEEWRAGRMHDPASVDANYLRRSDAVVVRAKAEPAGQTSRAEDVR